MDNTDTFEYNYSAERAGEVEAIRKKYEEPEEDKFEQLKALDRQVERTDPFNCHRYHRHADSGNRNEHGDGRTGSGIYRNFSFNSRALPG